MQMGLMEYTSELQYQFRMVRRDEREILTTSKTRGIVNCPDRFKRLAPGCHRTVPLKDQGGEGYDKQPETQYPGMKTFTGWDERNAAPLLGLMPLVL